MLEEFKHLGSISSRKADIIILAILSVVLVITRVPFLGKYLYEWDSVNYALGFEKYDVIHHQPHPPGYIFFVGLGRLLNNLFNDTNTTILFITLIFSILTVILIYFLVKQMYSREMSVIVSLVLIFNPLFWFYNEIATIYTSEAFFASLIAYLLYQVLRGNENYFYIATLALGLSGGFRQDLVILMFPLWLFCLFYSKRDINRILKGFGVLIPSVLIWFIPSVIFAGGYAQYLQATNFLFQMCIPRSSIIYGSGIFNRLSNIGAFFSWISLVLTFFGLFILLWFVKINHPQNTMQLKKAIKTPTGIFLALWIIPSSLFYLLIHLPKPGYMLSYLPAVSIILGYIFKEFSISLSKFKDISSSKILIIILSLFIIINSIYFLSPYNYNEENIWETPFYGMTNNEKLLWGLDIGFMYTNQKIKTNDEVTGIYINAIKKVPDSNPKNTILVIGDISRVNEGFSWRKAMYYFPEYDSYYLIQRENYIMNPWHGINHTNYWSSSQIFEIPINKSTEKVIWVVNDKSEYFKELNSQTKIKTINLDKGLKLYYSDIKNEKPKNNKFVFNLDSNDM